MGSPTLSSDVPANLPIATPDAQIGYQVASVAPETVSDTASDAVSAVVVAEELDMEALTDLENHAHQNHILLSSDAMRYLAGSTPIADQLPLLDKVITAAKAAFPSDDGWVVVNLSRMEHLLSEVGDATPASVLAAAPAAPMQAGSLAEAIVIGNVAAAYQLIEHRPMVALADAAADLDAVYRSKLGERVPVSELLDTTSQTLTLDQVRAAIVALTSALDGTYTSEQEAVKVAILKAVKTLS